MADFRIFPLADALTVTTGRLLCHDHMGGVYRILNYLTGDDLMTHQLPRAMDACTPAVLAQHPQLAGVEPPTDIDAPDVAAWLAWAESEYGNEFPLVPIGDWEQRNPIEEACDMFGAERVYVARTPEEAGRG